VRGGDFPGPWTADAPTLARAAVVEGLFAVLWFSWGPPDPPAWLAGATQAGAVLALAVAVAGLMAGRRVRDRATTMRQASVQRRYARVVAVEFALLIGVGVVLGVTAGAAWAAVWVCAVVGLHFFPLARVLPGLALPALGAAITAVAAGALAVGVTTDVVPTAVTGPGTGLALLVAATGSLVVLLRGARQPG
jgi:hypothetical protein